MTKFRSTETYTTRRRAVATVERATFVCFSIGSQRLAGPVEFIDRVLRPGSSDTVVEYEGRQLPYVDIATPLGLTLGNGDAAARRVLVARIADHWFAIPVDAVHDVLTVDASDLAPIPSAQLDDHRRGVIASFQRGSVTLLVIDLVRLLS